MWARILSAALGIWLMAAPAILDYAGPARTNDRVVGPVAASFAVVAIWEVVRPVRWIGVPLGGWLLLAPWVLAYGDTAAIVNSTVVGLLLVALAVVRGEVRQSFGGGWSSLWRAGDGPHPPNRAGGARLSGLGDGATGRGR